MADNSQMMDKYNNKDFEAFLKSEGKGSADSIWNNGSGEAELKDLFDAFKKKQGENTDEQAGNTEGHATLNVSQQVSDGDTNQNLNVSQNQPLQDNDGDWIKKKRESWQPWCEKEHNPPYIYDENQEIKDGLKFDVYKTAEDKAAGKKAASIHYSSPRDVTMETEVGKTPDYEFFGKLAKEAKEDKIPGVTFEGEMTPDFKAKLAAACLEHGLKMENGPEMIDVNLLGNVSEDVKKKVEAFNKTAENKKFYEQAKAEAKALKEQNGSASFSLKDEKDPSKQAMLYAAYSNAGVKVTDTYDATKETKGYFKTEGLDFIGKEEMKPLETYNGKQQRIDDVRAKSHARLSEKVMSGDQEALATMEEREDVGMARANIRSGKGTQVDKDIIAKRIAAQKQATH